MKDKNLNGLIQSIIENDLDRIITNIMLNEYSDELKELGYNPDTDRELVNDSVIEVLTDNGINYYE